MRNSLLSLALVSAAKLHAQWTSIPTGDATSSEAVLVIDATHYIVAGEDGVNFRTDDGGMNWTPVTDLGAESVRDFLRLDAQTLLAASDGVVLRSIDNGDTWTAINTPATDDLHALSHWGDVVVAVGREGNIIYSDDAGLTWAAQTSGTDERIFTVFARSSTEFFAGGKNGVFLHTTNGGSTWNAETVPGDDDWLGLHFFQNQPLVGLLCGEDGTVLRTIDGGTNWSAVDIGTNAALGGMASANDSVVYVVGTSGTVVKSNDQGLTWTDMSTPISDDLFAVDVQDGMAVAAGASGTVIKLGDSGVGIVEHNASNTVMLYPNPTANQLYLRWNDASFTRSPYSIVDGMGRTVQQGQITSAGMEMDVTGLAQGTYALRIGTHERAINRTFVVIR